MKIKHCVYFLTFLSLLSLACAKIEVAEIKFNHDTTSWSNDALNIRQNFTQIINVPEWSAVKTNPKDSPAAFVGGRSVKVMVKFKGSRDGVYKVYTQGGPFSFKKRPLSRFSMAFRIRPGFHSRPRIYRQGLPLPM